MIPAFLSVTISYLMALMAMAFYTLLERKFLGYFHLRKGPNKVMLMGLTQPFADAIKLFVKQQTYSNPSNKLIAFMAPVLGLFLSLMLWVLFPHMSPSYWFQFGVLYFLCVSSVNVYVMFLAGWSTNSKYSLLGALRAVAQTISYEVSMSIVLITPFLLTHTLDFSKMAQDSKTLLALIMMPLACMWFITILAETNRTPFDFAEGESELVSGFNVEYSSGLFALIFMAEYSNILIMSVLTSAIFLTMLPFSFSIVMLGLMVSILFVWVRATYPRMRYDFLMMLAWKSFLPASLSFFLFFFFL